MLLFPIASSPLLCSVDAIDPLLDCEPVNMHAFLQGSFSERLASLTALKTLVQTGEQKQLNLSISELTRLICMWYLHINTTHTYTPHTCTHIHTGVSLGPSEIPNFYELIAAPATKISSTPTPHSTPSLPPHPFPPTHGI